MTTASGRRGKALVEPDDAEETIDIGTSAAAESFRRFRLVLDDGGAPDLVWTSKGERCSVGSHPSNDLVVDDPSVSRFHCEITAHDRWPRLRDLDSLNGTFVDGTRIADVFLRTGTVIRIGRKALRFELDTEDDLRPLSNARSFGGLVGGSIAMRAVYAVLERVAPSDSTVLLEGETGTGKEVAADAIHQASARRDGPLVVVDCGAVPPNLLESLLFGHERGAFTGADQRRIGAFEEAHGGTVFLDELGELPLELQPKLLRVLERRQVQRVGASAARNVDVRIVAATNRDLRALVNAARFRSDLYYRLAVIRVRLPALRERPEDIPDLVQHFLDGFGASPEARARLMAPELLGGLSRAAWPGNVRELRNVVERSLVLESPRFEPESSEVAHGSPPRVDPRLPYNEARRRALDDFEREYMQALLELHGGKVSQAAKAAGIGRVYLHRLVRRHGVR